MVAPPALPALSESLQISAKHIISMAAFAIQLCISPSVGFISKDSASIYGNSVSLLIDCLDKHRLKTMGYPNIPTVTKADSWR